MKMIKELDDDGIKYKRLHWRWMTPYYRLETREFSEDLQRMSFKEYAEKMVVKLNNEEECLDNMLVYKEYGGIKYVTIVRREE